jgi:hypothetical protein
LYSDIVLRDPSFHVPRVKVRPLSLRKIAVQMLRGRYIPPMAPLKDRLTRPSHFTSSLPTFPPIIDITEDEEEEKKLLDTCSKEPMWHLKFGGRITTGGSGKYPKQPKPTDPTTSIVPLKQKAPQTMCQSREEWRLCMKFNPHDTVWLGWWLEKLPPGSTIPPPLVQVVILMNAAGQLVETMAGFVLWDACLVSNDSQILAESLTLNLDREFLGDMSL